MPGGGIHVIVINLPIVRSNDADIIGCFAAEPLLTYVILACAASSDWIAAA
jgi:hypothetical protein